MTAPMISPTMAMGTTLPPSALGSLASILCNCNQGVLDERVQGGVVPATTFSSESLVNLHVGPANSPHRKFWHPFGNEFVDYAGAAKFSAGPFVVRALGPEADSDRDAVLKARNVFNCFGALLAAGYFPRLSDGLRMEVGRILESGETAMDGIGKLFALRRVYDAAITSALEEGAIAGIVHGGTARNIEDERGVKIGKNPAGGIKLSYANEDIEHAAIPLILAHGAAVLFGVTHSFKGLNGKPNGLSFMSGGPSQLGLAISRTEGAMQFGDGVAVIVIDRVLRPGSRFANLPENPASIAPDIRIRVLGLDDSETHERVVEMGAHRLFEDDSREIQRPEVLTTELFGRKTGELFAVHTAIGKISLEPGKHMVAVGISDARHSDGTHFHPQSSFPLDYLVEPERGIREYASRPRSADQ